MFWTADAGIDGKTPVDLGDLGVVCIDALPSWVWYQDMPDFAEALTGGRAGRQLARAIQGRGAFRRFNDELHEAHPGPAADVVRLLRCPPPPPIRPVAGGNSLIDDGGG